MLAGTAGTFREDGTRFGLEGGWVVQEAQYRQPRPCET